MEAPRHEIDTTGLTVGGILAGVTAITLNQWVAIATLIYFIFQILISLPKAIDTIKILWARYGRRK